MMLLGWLAAAASDPATTDEMSTNPLFFVLTHAGLRQLFGQRAMIMPETIAAPPAQFLKSDAIRGGMDLLMFAHKSHLRHADEALALRGLGRAHHRVLYFLSRRPGGTVTDLLLTLAITKQSLGRVSKELKERGLIETRSSAKDRRAKLLFLTEEGKRFEQSVFDQLHQNMSRAYAAAGEEAVQGYWTLMQHLMDGASHDRFLEFAGHGSDSCRHEPVPKPGSVG